MEKQILKAFLISIAILLGWQLIMAWLNPPKPDAGGAPAAVVQPAPTQPQPPTAEQPPPAPVVAVEAGAVEPERTITVKTSHWVATFSNRGAMPVSWKLLKLTVDGVE